MSLVMTAFSQTILFKSLLAIRPTLLLIDLYEGAIGNFNKAVKYIIMYISNMTLNIYYDFKMIF